MLLDNICDLAKFSAEGRPFIYKNSHSISLLFDGSAIQSEMYLSAPDELLLGYTITMMGFLLFNDNPKSIAMIGLGGGSMLKYCYRHLPHAAIVVAENNPDVIALRKHFHIPEDSDRMQIRCMDGGKLVRDADGDYDILLVDGFDRSGQPPQLCSQMFYDDCYQALAQEGMMIVNLLGNNKDTGVYLDRIQCSFDGAVVAIDARESGNRIVFACKGPLLDTAEQTLNKRLKDLSPRNALMLRLTAQNIMQQRRNDRLAAALA